MVNCIIMVKVCNSTFIGPCQNPRPECFLFKEVFSNLDLYDPSPRLMTLILDPADLWPRIIGPCPALLGQGFVDWLGLQEPYIKPTFSESL